ncbi:MAG TPA: hypothetical protein VLX29_06610, partial [Nitrospirota bacterium]|nr:hypothetical protein [Nitrospirota bacterium]
KLDCRLQSLRWNRDWGVRLPATSCDSLCALCFTPQDFVRSALARRQHRYVRGRSPQLLTARQ